MNAAAHLFDGYTLEQEDTKVSDKAGKLSGKIGFNFLNGLLTSPSLEGEGAIANSNKTVANRMYTLGGLHMSVLEEMAKKKLLQPLNLQTAIINPKYSSYVSTDVVLRPVDIFGFIELLSLLRPLITQALEQFGKTWFKDIKAEDWTVLPKADALIASLLESLREDYLLSNNLEMIMTDANNGADVGIVDIDISNLNPAEIKARLTDGQFHLVGKVIRGVGGESNLSTIQRSSLHQLLETLSRLAGLLGTEQHAGYEVILRGILDKIDKVIGLEVKGPAVRVLAMSISA